MTEKKNQSIENLVQAIILLLLFVTIIGFLLWPVYLKKKERDKLNLEVEQRSKREEIDRRAKHIKRQYYYILGTASRGGAYYYNGCLLSEIFLQNQLARPLRTVTSAGSLQNVEALVNSEFDFAMLEYRVLLNKIAENPRIKDKIKLLFKLWEEQIQIVYRQASWQEKKPTLEELLKTRISVGRKNSGTADLYQRICNSLGINNTETTVQMSYEDAATAMKKGQIDTGFFTGAAPLPAVETLLASSSFKLYSLSTEEQEKTTKAFPFLRNSSLAKKHYAGLPENLVIASLAHDNYMVCRELLEEEVIIKFLEVVEKSDSILKSSSIAWGEVRLLPGENLQVPYHPAVYKWLKHREEEKTIDEEVDTDLEVEEEAVGEEN
ncbi:TAXI family TRAP transporter solute-binding subunit [Candidatus Riflebacteria bacterium]